MARTVPAEVSAEVSAQLSLAVQALQAHLHGKLVAVHLYGSALQGGLKPLSDIDLLVSVTQRLAEPVRRALMLDLLQHSAWPGESASLRALEVTVVVQGDVVPWRYPPRRELQFGEWLRADLLAGRFEPPCHDPDLAILLTQARQHSRPLMGPPADELWAPVPEVDLLRALAQTMQLWNAAPDWVGDERNVVLTLARVWYSAATGAIAPKEQAAQWALARLPAAHQAVLLEACEAYLGRGPDRLASRPAEMAEFVAFAKGEITRSLGPRWSAQA